jgi:hypothetical protein
MIYWLLSTLLSALPALTPTERWAYEQRYASLQRQIESTADVRELERLNADRAVVNDALGLDDVRRLGRISRELR